MLAASAMEGSRTTLDETVMPPPSTPRGVKRKTIDKEPILPVSARQLHFIFAFLGTWCGRCIVYKVMFKGPKCFFISVLTHLKPIS